MLLIKNGTIIDPSQSLEKRKDLLIRDGRVEDIDPGAERLTHDLPAGRFVQRPRPPAPARLAEAHAPQRDRGNLKSGLPELRVPHESSVG